jgi:hypothetical protein
MAGGELRLGAVATYMLTLLARNKHEITYLHAYTISQKNPLPHPNKRIPPLEALELRLEVE